MTVFIPCTALVARSWRDQGMPPKLLGYAATVSMLAAHGLEPGDEEEGDFTALNYAATAALDMWAPDDQRLVLAVATAARNTVPRGWSAQDAAEVGAVAVDDVAWRQVTAIFADEPGSAEAVVQAKAALGSRTWLEAWDDPAVEKLVTEFDLLWHVPDELDALIEEG